MTNVVIGLIVAVIVFSIILYGGRHEPTHHGQGIIARFAFIIAIVAGILGGILSWIF